MLELGVPGGEGLFLRANVPVLIYAHLALGYEAGPLTISLACLHL